MIHDWVENASSLTRYQFKQVARSSDRALKNFRIAQERIFSSADVAAQRVWATLAISPHPQRCSS
jgi:hypothetical protein